MATKPKGVKGYRSKYVSLRLPKKLKDELAVIAGYVDASDKDATLLVGEVQFVLGLQAMEDKADREGPGPSGQAKIWRAVEDAAVSLEQALLDVDEASYRSLSFLVLVRRFGASWLETIFPKLAPNSPEVDTSSLSALRQVATEMRKQREGQKGGRRPERARDDAIEMLAEAFHGKAKIADASEYRYALLDFTRLALRAIRFSPLSDEKRWQRVPRQFRRP